MRGEAAAPLGIKVVMVAARARNGVIGNQGKIPWHIPEDFAHFKRVTVGHPLILGRTTFEGIGRPLPDRQSIVLTRSDWSYPGVLVAATIKEALAQARELDDVVTIGGGGHVYDAAMPYATHQILTDVQIDAEGDTLYPIFDEAEWIETEREKHLDDPTPWVVRWLARV